MQPKLGGFYCVPKLPKSADSKFIQPIRTDDISDAFDANGLCSLIALFSAYCWDIQNSPSGIASWYRSSHSSFQGFCTSAAHIAFSNFSFYV